MFIKDGKSLLGNWGLIISLAVLVILLFFSYNKCMISLDREGFAASIQSNAYADSVKPTTTSTKDVSFPPPQNPRVNITGSTITLNFTVAPVAGTPTPIQFMVVLVQYDSKLTPTGNNKFYISNESIINPSVSSIPATGTTIETPTNNSLCQLVNGSPACQYIFKNLDMVDTSGNPYYYKVGISAVYTNGNSRFVLPYNVVNSNGIFSLATPLDAQNNQFSDYIRYKQMQTQMKSANYASGTMATPDGQYELIKSQLGGYPSNLVMDPTSAKQNMLSDLVDKSMAQALLNVNVST